MGTIKNLANSSPSDRLMSIDALRGFDMFWIMGGETIITRLARWGNWSFADKVHEQFEHVEWEGFRFYDLIFPLFLFIVGVVLPFSLGKLRQEGASPGGIYGRIIRRTILLFFFGLLCNNFLQLDFENLRVAGVLQRIALCYFFAALVVANVGAIGQAIVTAALLAGYWALLAYVPAPDHAPGDFSKYGNLPGWVDAHWLPGKIMPAYYGYGDNEGILSTIPAIGTVLIGALAGAWLRLRRTPIVTVLALTAAGALSMAGGYYWGQSFPIIKNIWTSSYVLVAAGYSLLLLALFYGVIDGLRFRAWAFFLVVIGANAIIIYVAPHFIDFHHMADFFLGGLFQRSGSFKPVFEAIGVVVVEWFCLLFLFRNRLFLRA